MQTIERVSIDDVYPYRDEYGNAVLSRDYETKENKAYIEELKRSMRATGEPFEPPTLYRDGGTYVVVSGNSRVRAMRELGTKTFTAIVMDADEGREAAYRLAVEATVRTNAKKKYSGTEESRYVQQLALLADDEYVAEASGLDVERVRGVRRARAMVEDAAEDMSLDRLLAISELADDQDAVAALTSCKEGEWQAVARRERWRVEEQRAKRAIAERLEEAGITVLANVPVGAIFVAHVSDPDGVPETGGPLDPTIALSTTGRGYSLFRMPTAEEREEEGERDAAEQARAEQIAISKDRDRALTKRSRERRRQWLSERLANFDPKRVPNLCELAANLLSDEWGNEAALVREADATPTVGSLGVAHAVMDHEGRSDTYGYGVHWYGFAGDGQRSVLPKCAHPWLDLMGAMRADGYEPDEYETECMEDAEAALGRE